MFAILTRRDAADDIGTVLYRLFGILSCLERISRLTSTDNLE